MILCVVCFGGSSAVEADDTRGPLHLRGDLTAEQSALFVDLQERVGGRVAVRVDDDGTLRYLAGVDVAPDCRLDGEVDVDSMETLARCVFESWKTLLPGLDEGEDVGWGVTHVEPHNDFGLASASIRQISRGVPVDGGDATLVVLEDRLVSFGGTMFPAERIALDPDLELAEPEELAAHVADRLGAETRWMWREIAPVGVDSEQAEPVSYLATLDPDTEPSADEEFPVGAVWAFHEISGTLEPVEVGAGHHVSQSTNTTVADYRSAWTRTPAQAPRTRTEPITVRRLDRNGGICRVDLDAGSDEHRDLIGNPKTYLASGTSRGGNPVEDDVSCFFNSFGFGTYPTTRVGLAANAHFWVHDLARFTRDSNTAYDEVFRYSEPENLRVVVQEETSCLNGDTACMWPTLRWIGLPWDVGTITEWKMLLPENTGAVDSLRTMAHEMGHYVGYGYEHYHQVGLRGLLDGATEEGFADHNVLRYAMFRLREAANRPHDSRFGSTFETDHWAQRTRSHVTEQVFNNGESGPRGHLRAVDPDPMDGVTPGLHDDDIFTPMTYRPWHHESPCNENHPAHNKYVCGSVIGSVYWTLVWNEIRVGFNGFRAGDEILDDSPPPSVGAIHRAERWANFAFSFAVASISRNARVDEYFDRVSEAYHLLMQLGLVTGDEFHRVNQVLTAACVGWSDHVCRSRHVTTWGVLPVMYTEKQTLTNDPTDYGSREFLRAQDFTLRGGASSHVFADGANDTPPAKFVRLDEAGESIEIRFVVPTDGRYQIHGAVLGHAGCCDSVWVQVDGSAQEYWDLSGTGAWEWEHDGPTFQLTAGWHTLRLKHRENISIEAVFLERVP